MTQTDDLALAIQKLASEANEESAAAKAEYEEQLRELRARLLEGRIARSSIAQNGEEELEEAYQARLA